MKYIQLFETKEGNYTGDFKIGDIVICIKKDNYSSITGSDENILTYNGFYQIEDAKTTFSEDQLKLVGVDYYWREDRFILSTPEERKEYLIKKIQQKNIIYNEIY